MPNRLTMFVIACITDVTSAFVVGVVFGNSIWKENSIKVFAIKGRTTTLTNELAPSTINKN